MYLQVPSQYSNNCIRDEEEEVVINELQNLADLAASITPVVSIAFEPLSMGISHSTWEDALRVVQRVNRDNFGFCIDSFHIATKLWADPFSGDGTMRKADERLRESLRRIVGLCPIEKIFYVQLSDGERFTPPFSEKHPWFVTGEAPLFSWSKNARPFPLETQLGGYLPVVEIAGACIVQKGFTGWVSLETFDWRMRAEGFRPGEAAARGIEAWKRVQIAMERGTVPTR